MAGTRRPRAAMDRRLFLKVLAVNSAVVGGAGLAGYHAARRLRASRFDVSDDPVAEAIRDALPQLPLDDPVLWHFSVDYRRHAARAQRYSVPDRPGLVETFLLSTDFFQTGADPTRPPRYVAFYSPYVSPCYNPLARLR